MARPTGTLIRKHQRQEGLSASQPPSVGPTTGADDHGDAEQRERLPALLGREGVRQNGLRDRHHAAAGEPLQEPEQEQRVEIPGLRAKKRAHGEEAEAGEEERLAAELPGEEGARREADGIGDEIGRHHPGRLVVADPHAAGDIGQHDVGDRRVEHLHEGRERDQHGDQPGACPRRRSPQRRSRACVVALMTRRRGQAAQPGQARLELLPEGRRGVDAHGRRDRHAGTERHVLRRMSSKTILTGTRWTIFT